MKVLIHSSIIAAAVFLADHAFAAERAVEGSHIELDVNSIDNDSSGAASSASLGAGVTATIPLGSYFGATLGTDYLRTRVRTGDLFSGLGASGGSLPSCRYDSLRGEAAFMFRLPRFLKVSAGYSIGDLNADCGESVFAETALDRADAEGLRFGAEAYLGNFTFGAERMQTSLDRGPQLRSTMLAASWYPLESLKVQVSGNDLYDRETYRILVEHQLEMLGDGFGIRAAFATNDATSRTRVFELGLSYYFGRQVSLQTRDRAWR